MHILLLVLALACAKKTESTTTDEIKNTEPTTEMSKRCQTTNDLCHDTAWLFWKGHLKPVTDAPETDWEQSNRVGQLNPRWLFGINNTGIAAHQGKDTSWNHILSYDPNISGLEISKSVFSELCEAGHQKSCVIKGIMISDSNREEAKALFQNACSEENGIGCYHLGSLSENPEESHRIWEQGANMKDANSSTALAYALLAEPNAEEQGNRINELLESSCLSTQTPEVFMGGPGFEIQVGRAEHFNGQAKACFTLGEKAATPEKIKELFMKSCRMEHAPACEKLCDDEAAESCFDLAALYKVGIGVEINPAESAKFFQRSCELGFKPGCTLPE